MNTLIRFRGSLGEHGPHTVRLGPDGLLYVLSGNFAQADVQFDPRSPIARCTRASWCSRDTKIRTGMPSASRRRAARSCAPTCHGSFVEIVAGGFRNPYDFAFNGDGELFTYDADMEWDIGAPWYRPTRVNHVPAGAEFGWRSGWAKWPEYYLDSLPGDAQHRPRLAHRRGVLRSRDVSGAAAEHAVRRRLGHRPNSRGEASSAMAPRTRPSTQRFSKAGR